MRWLVGDLQGCVKPFERLLKEIRFDAQRDELWCLGDLVNRGPESAAVLRLWNDLGGHGILGNHDVYALLANSGAWKRKRDTLDDLFAANDREALFESMRRLPLMLYLPASVDNTPDVWIVHAGLLPGWTELERLSVAVNETDHDDAWLQSDAVSVATRVRCCTREGQLSRATGPPEVCADPFRPWDSYYRGERTLGLDSGCVYGGPLTAWCQDEDRIVQVPGNNG